MSPRKKALGNISEYLSNTWRRDLAGDSLWTFNLPERPGFAECDVYYVTRTFSGRPGQLTGPVRSEKSRSNRTGERLRVGPLPFLFKFQFFEKDKEIKFKVKEHQWHPTHTETLFTARGLCLSEQKFITSDDQAISWVRLENTGRRPRSLKTIVTTPLALTPRTAILWENRNKNFVKWKATFNLKFRNTLNAVVDRYLLVQAPRFRAREDAFPPWPGRQGTRLERSIRLRPGRSTRLMVVFGINEDERHLHAKVRTTLRRRNPLGAHISTQNQWFRDNIPSFSGDDPYLEKLYYYRWFVARRNMLDPAVGNIKYPAIYEGKAAFEGVVSFSLPHQIIETRWLKSPLYGFSQIRNVIAGQITEGRNIGRWCDDYLNWIPWSAWLLYQVHPDKQFLREIYQPMLAYVQHEMSPYYDEDGDLLPTVRGSWRTGMEYQPSFFYFTQPRWDHTLSSPWGKEQVTALERVDEASYLHLNVLAISRMARALGEKAEAVRYERLARKIKDAVIKYMWDEKSKFFYDIHPLNHKKALAAKCIVGFYPFFALIADEGHLSIFEHLANEKEFWTPWPAPTVSRDCPAYSPTPHWKVGPHASREKPHLYRCSWNGPVWPLANSLLAESLARAAKISKNHKLTNLFSQFIRKFTLLHFKDRDINSPWLVEHYNPETGEPLSPYHDYFHSWFNDLIIRHIVGFTPRDDEKIELHPVDIGLNEFMIEGINYRGKNIDIRWQRPRKKGRLRNEGYFLFVNGKKVFRAYGLERALIDL